MILKKFTDQLKMIGWFFLRPVHPYIRDFLLFLGVIHHNGRQPFIIGHLLPNKNAEDLRKFLLNEKGFEDHFPCWNDDGEIIDVRLRENFDWQYHLRVFNDGEVRGHHEYTPESRPIAHLKDHKSTARVEEFRKFLDGWIV